MRAAMDRGPADYRPALSRWKGRQEGSLAFDGAMTLSQVLYSLWLGNLQAKIRA